MTDAINQHKLMAMGTNPMGTDSNFGVEPIAAHKHKKNHPDNGSKTQRTVAADGGRGAKPPIPAGKTSNQAQPDHGPADYL